MWGGKEADRKVETLGQILTVFRPRAQLTDSPHAVHGEPRWVAVRVQHLLVHVDDMLQLGDLRQHILDAREQWV